MSVPASLLIDDEEKFSESIAARFSARGLALDTASNWDDGLELFFVGGHELVIADYNLNGAKLGLELLAAIKPLKPSTRLILISGALTNDAEVVVRDTPLVDRYLRKGRGITDILLEEAEDAATRGAAPRDWKSISRAHLAGAEIDRAQIDRIDEMLRERLR